MRELIYYPSFEIQNNDWVKFALLYLNQLDPIIPKTGEKYLTDDYKKLINETDLIKPFRPSYHEGEMATLDAIDKIEKIFKHPKAYASIFNDKNFIKKWKNKKHQTCTLFREKYTHYWGEFCEHNKIGHFSAQGLLISSDIANIYMTILAQCVADIKGVSPITDNKFLDHFSIFTRKSKKHTQDIIKTAQAVINLKLPKNLNEIAIDKIIKFRNKNGFKEKQKAFHCEIENYLCKLETDPNPDEFNNQLGNLWQDFSDDIAQIGTGTIAFGLGAWLLFQGSGDITAPAFKELAGGAAITVGSVIAIRKTWKNTKTKRMTRRYLSNISTIQPVTI